jgi:threonine aldolase
MEIPGLKLSSEPRHHFASDNNAPAHPQVMEAIIEANQGHALAYGSDYFTDRAVTSLKQVFGQRCEPFFVFTGTGANVLSLAALTRSYHAVICAEESHLNGPECAAPEQIARVKLFGVPTRTGKISIPDIERFFDHRGDQHHAQPKVISLTQTTDFGMCYTLEEVREICDFAHENEMVVHMDGARLSNACAALDVSLKQMTADSGLDVLSLGGTKNGLLGAEAVLFFNPELAEDFLYIRKQGMQLASKMRFLAVQLEALFGGDLWLHNARQANRMARMLAEGLEKIPGVHISRQIQSNMVYCRLPAESIPRIQEDYLFYVFDPQASEVRLVTSYDSTEDDVRGFLTAAAQAIECATCSDS